MQFGNPIRPAGAEAPPGTVLAGLPTAVTRFAAPLTTNRMLPMVNRAATSQPGLRQCLWGAATPRSRPTGGALLTLHLSRRLPNAKLHPAQPGHTSHQRNLLLFPGSLFDVEAAHPVNGRRRHATLVIVGDALALAAGHPAERLSVGARACGDERGRAGWASWARGGRAGAQGRMASSP